MDKKQKFYITTAIVYTSAKPHIGNCYDVVVSDAYARFKRYEGFDVFFMTGTDEHGEKIEKKAKEQNVSCKDYVDNIANEIKTIWDSLNTSYNKFMRTTDQDHIEQVQNIFKKLYDQGDIYKGTYEGSYCTPCESFFTDSQLIDGKCPDCGREVYKMSEEAYFFKMSKYANKLIKHFEENGEFILPISRKNEMINNFLKPGLKDLCVSRSSFKWGIPVSFDEKHVVYVWLDALTNYITGIGYNANKGRDGSSDLYKKYWPADVHIIGKDIVRFHSIYWPIFLMALGEELPKKIFGHPWLLSAPDKEQNSDEGIKMSKSRGNVLYPDTLINIFGVDGVRFFLLHEMPYDNDGLISLDLVCEKYNSELANVLGNLVQRTIAMVNKYNNGIVENTNSFTEEEKIIDLDLQNTIKKCIEKNITLMEEYKVANSFDAIFDICKRANKYIDETFPWIVAKDPNKKDRLNTILYNLVEAIVIVASLLNSYLPQTSDTILNELNINIIPFIKIKNYEFGKIQKVKINENPQILFQRKDIKEINV